VPVQNSATPLLSHEALRGVIEGEHEVMPTVFNHGPSGTLSRNPFNKGLDASVLALSALLVFSAAQMYAQTPNINEYTVPAANFSGLQGITAGPDGALWFCEYASPSTTSKIGRITTAGFLTEYTVPAGSAGFPGVLEIHAGADGALWFTEFIANQIGRITTAGVITEFTVPTTDSRPTEITAGPDGALWFTENSGNKIGRITTAGVITEFTVPTANSSSTGITLGPDGALWFAEFNSNKIGRITTAGMITEFPVPTANSGPNVVTAGPDKALWFTEYNTKQIGRITTAGVITEFPVPTATSPPNRIAAGSDGALWFTEVMPLSTTNTSNISDKIGRITTTASFTEYTVPTPNSGTNDITLGPDGALWFTEYSANQIGQVQPTAATGTINITTDNGAATFTITGPATYNGSGLFFTQPNAPVGTYTVHYSAVSKYITPADQTGTLTAGQISLLVPEALYTPITLTACPTNSPTCAQSLSFSFQQGVAGPVAPQQVVVTSNGPSVGFSVLSTSTPPGWLSVTVPPTLTTSAMLIVNVVPNQSLKAGTYTGQISLASNGVTNSPQVILVTLTVTRGVSACPVTGLKTNVKASNGVIIATASPGLNPCEFIITLGNPKTYWTNFRISTTGSVTTQPVGGALNFYTAALVLPASFPIIPNPPVGTPASYIVRFTRPGETLTIFADPTIQTGINAAAMNLAQGLLDLLPSGSGKLTLTIDSVSRIGDAFGQMPHLKAAATALFQSHPDLTQAGNQLYLFFTGSELSTFNALLVELGAQVIFGTITDALSYVGQLIAAIAADVGNIYTLTFGYPSGSIEFKAQ
jgi:virginiamycin B lyase